MTHELDLAVLLAGPCLAAAMAMLVLSKSCRYYLKYTVYMLGVSLVALTMTPIFMFRPFNVLNFVLASAICKNISRLIGLHWVLRGREHLAEQRACVIVANHQSSLDILGMFEYWNVMKKCTVVAKKELFYAWPFGLAAWLCGLIFIDRLNSGRAKDSINKAATQIKQDQVKLWIFPEGTRKNTGEIHPFKKGAFHVAVSAQLPILPVVYSPYYFLDDRHRTFDSGNVIISALPPISTEGLTMEDIDSLMERVRQCMVDEFMKMSKEVKSDLLPPYQISGS
ncbi:1-acyl-sn-glycerol-3-phosphate acyltransferase alpha isoform X1 [Frankliniella occidentalis]|uniref:1-acyl-sn-glycerol-3-phosphate acyltransferase n=1 Tax=Frankliniella occidentalis TaxID=133901 RepID=A0A6J1T5R8_FRAOC|nr:1-acyl-sn-glycerol-3-phosphate acyltransferase alpha isoform X1 [Frankliniella occidentalis]